MAKQPTIKNGEWQAIGLRSADDYQVFGRVAHTLLQQGSYDKATLMTLLAALVRAPQDFAQHPQLGVLAEYVLAAQQAGRLSFQAEREHALLSTPLPYQVFGVEQIDPAAMAQMDAAMTLPISLQGSLMPDAHPGYGLPIGGVLATHANTVIPYAVGVDIACRMCLSVFDVRSTAVREDPHTYKRLLAEHTYFGIGGTNPQPLLTDVFDRPEWKELQLLRDLKSKAYKQLGTSGTGNHFVEWGELEVLADDALLGLPVGRYLALLSHSGSRGLGATIANTYSKLARERVHLPAAVQHLAWLELSSSEGQEYWLGMNLAGHYASANHHEIHAKLSRALGVQPIRMVENHHNFAWLEELPNGTQAMVHRKGATPAGVNDLGIIPGSMTHTGYVVRGRGHDGALHSAAHGAGRAMSRRRATEQFSTHEILQAVRRAGVHLLGADLDEAPMAYKNIQQVMAAQQELITVLGQFTPVVVRMAAPKDGPAED